MSVLLGSSHPTTFPLNVTVDQVHAFARYLHDHVGMRSDTAETLATFAAAVATCPLPQYSLRRLAPCVPGGFDADARAMRNALTGNGCTDHQLLCALIAATPYSSVRAILLQYHTVTVAGGEWGVLSLHAVGEGWIVPLDWRRFRLGHEDEADSIDAESDCIRQLLTEFAVAWRKVVPNGFMPPLVSAEPWFGETPRVRRVVAATVREYALAVRGDYTGARIERDNPYALRDHHGMIDELFGAPSADDPLPLPQRVELGTAVAEELATPYLLDARVSYAIVRVFTPGLLKGHRAVRRAAALGEVLACLQSAPMTRAVGLHGFELAHDLGWRRGALAVSLFHAFLSARSRVPSCRGRKESTG
jgi:hypothetical protein